MVLIQERRPRRAWIKQGQFPAPLAENAAGGFQRKQAAQGVIMPDADEPQIAQDRLVRVRCRDRSRLHERVRIQRKSLCALVMEGDQFRVARRDHGDPVSPDRIAGPGFRRCAAPLVMRVLIDQTPCALR